MSSEMLYISGESREPSPQAQFWLAQFAARVKFEEALVRQSEVPSTELYLISGQDHITKDDIAWFRVADDVEALLAGKGDVEVLQVGLPIYKQEGWHERPERVALKAFFDDSYLLLSSNADEFEALERLTAESDWQGAYRDLAQKVRTYDLVPGRFTDRQGSSVFA